MYEVRWHGRGGHGVVTASDILALAALQENKFFQSFPDFGPERMGAPIKAYTRIDDASIAIHSQIYEPDAVVVLDQSLLETEKVSDGLKEDGIFIINSHLSKEEIRKKFNFSGKIFVVDATKIAFETIKKPITNTCGVGALTKVSGIVKIENVITAISEVLGKKLSEKQIKGNIEAAYRGLNEVT